MVKWALSWFISLWTFQIATFYLWWIWALLGACPLFWSFHQILSVDYLIDFTINCVVLRDLVIILSFFIVYLNWRFPEECALLGHLPGIQSRLHLRCRSLQLQWFLFRIFMLLKTNYQIFLIHFILIFKNILILDFRGQMFWSRIGSWSISASYSLVFLRWFS